MVYETRINKPLLVVRSMASFSGSDPTVSSQQHWSFMMALIGTDNIKRVEDTKEI